MTTLCNSLIDRAIAVNCERSKGFKATGILVNYEDVDWASSTRSTTKKLVFEDFVLKTGKTGFKVEQEQKNAFNETGTELAVGDTSNTFTHTTAFKLFGGDVDKAEVATILARGLFVLILEQKERGTNGESKWRVYGATNGLSASSITNTPNGDNGNIWDVQLQEEGATEAANFIFDTDEATTDTKIASLTTA